MMVLRYSIHRKEQWDLDCVPLVCVHRRTPNSSTRVFCVWWLGIQIGALLLSTKALIFRRQVLLRFAKGGG